jgi:hypothetical protein
MSARMFASRRRNVQHGVSSSQPELAECGRADYHAPAMASPSTLKAWVPGVLALVALLATCEGPLTQEPGATPEADTVDRLQGAWLREEVHGSVRARRILTLRADGGFEERVRIVDAAGGATEQVHAGTWLYDGTNLKRKYTLMNGSPPSRLNLPFATFQIAFDSRDAFVGVDHVHGNRIAYQRVAEGTLP